MNLGISAGGLLEDLVNPPERGLRNLMLVTLYTKPDCHLCTDLKAKLNSFQHHLDLTIIERNIEENEDDFARFRYLIPVLDIADGPTLFPPHDEEEIRRLLLAVSPQSID